MISKKDKVVIKELMTIGEVEHFVTLSTQMYNELQPVHSFSADAIYRTAERILVDFDRDRENAWIVFNGDEPIAFGYGYCSPVLYSDDASASLNYWYVIPKYRKTIAAGLILREFERWARLSGAVEVLIGVMNEHDVTTADRLNRMFEKRSIKRVGTAFQKRLIEE